MLLQISSLSALNKYKRSSLSQIRYKTAYHQYFFWENGNGMLFLVRLQALQFYCRTGRNHRSFSLKLRKCIRTATLHQKCPNMEFFWSVFFSIWIKYEDFCSHILQNTSDITNYMNKLIANCLSERRLISNFKNWLKNFCRQIRSNISRIFKSYKITLLIIFWSNKNMLWDIGWIKFFLCQLHKRCPSDSEAIYKKNWIYKFT